MNPCIRCGKTRIKSRSWSEKINNSLVIYTQMVCPDADCQKIVEDEQQMKKDKLGGRERAEADGQLIFGEGFSKTADLLQDALDKNIITRTGNTYWMDKEKLGSISKLREKMKDPEFVSLLQERLK